VAPELASKVPWLAMLRSAPLTEPPFDTAKVPLATLSVVPISSKLPASATVADALAMVSVCACTSELMVTV